MLVCTFGSIPWPIGPLPAERLNSSDHRLAKSSCKLGISNGQAWIYCSPIFSLSSVHLLQTKKKTCEIKEWKGRVWGEPPWHLKPPTTHWLTMTVLNTHRIPHVLAPCPAQQPQHRAQSNSVHGVPGTSVQPCSSMEWWAPEGSKGPSTRINIVWSVI